MEALQAFIPLAITISLAGLVLAVGLHATLGDIFYVLRRPSQLFRGILAVLILPPIIAGIVVALLPLSPIVKAAIMVMAISPVPPLVPGKELAIGGRKEYAYGLYVAMALLSIVSVPLVFSIASSVFGRDDTISIASIARTVFIGVIVPLAIGLVIRRFAPDFAERTWSIIYKASMVLVLLAFLPILITSFGALTKLIGDGTLLAMGVVTAACLAIGHALGGPDLRDRATLATAASVRHPGIAMSIAGTVFHQPQVSAAILLFLLWGLVVSAPYKSWIKRGHSVRHAH
jgi:BASS family bile acid:Na+ symporter